MNIFFFFLMKKERERESKTHLHELVKEDIEQPLSFHSDELRHFGIRSSIQKLQESLKSGETNQRNPSMLKARSTEYKASSKSKNNREKKKKRKKKSCKLFAIQTSKPDLISCRTLLLVFEEASKLPVCLERHIRPLQLKNS
jgi:hypothetical protein